MRLLAIDTGGATGSVALAEVNAEGILKLAGEITLPGRTYSARLIPAIDELLHKEKVTLAALDALVVVRGPGSFTGLRVGLSAIKGLAEVTRKPVIALSRFAVMAARQPAEVVVHAILDAGRGQFYYGVYRDAGVTCVQESLETLDTLRTALQSAVGACIVAECSVAGIFESFCAIPVSSPTAADAFYLAWYSLQKKRFVDVALLDANYLRRSDAELFARSKSSGNF